MKTVFITGTSSGLGEATAKLFQSKGWNVIATMRNTRKASALSALANVTILPLDITDGEQIKLAVSKATALGNIDVVINNAAAGAIGPLEGFTEEQMVKLVDTNLLGAIRVTQAFIPYFRQKQSGLFINITSMAGLLTFPFASLYHAVKFGMEGWSEGMYYELKPFGIGVKTVAPGGIKSAFASNAAIVMHPAYQQQMDHYMSIVGNPQVIANYTEPETIANVVYEAVTDGKDQVHYIAGNDATQLYEHRLQAGAEASRKEIEKMFLA